MIDHRCDYFLGNEVGRWLDENATGNVSEAYTELGDLKLPAPSKCKRLVRIEQLSELDIVYCQVNVLCLSCICKHIEKANTYKSETDTGKQQTHPDQYSNTEHESGFFTNKVCVCSYSLICCDIHVCILLYSA